mgnify:CR=1 FL=1
MSHAWKNQKEFYNDTLRYVADRHNGTVTSFKTPWKKFNDAGIDGIEWNNIVVIGGRSGTGKTLIKDQIIRESQANNPNVKFNVLEFQLEMVARASKVREFSAVLGKSYKYICSTAGNHISKQDFDTLVKYSKDKINEDFVLDIVETPPTVKEFEKIVNDYMETNKTDEGYVKTIITVDHSYLIKTTGSQSKLDMLYDFGEVLTKLKKKYPIIFIILSQLNRSVESPERNENGKYGNYINATDIFGSDSLYQQADLVIGVNRPAQKNITLYGPDKYIIDSDSILVFHFLKCRNGDTRMSFFNAEFEKMKITEMPTPNTKQ